MLYGVVEAFRNGRLPTNDQIDKTLRYILDHSPVDIHKLSPEGRNFVQDAKDIIETARLMVHQKNADELLQNFIWHTRAVDSQKLKTNGLNDAIPTDSLKSDSDKGNIWQSHGLSVHIYWTFFWLAVRHLRTLLSIILTNSEVRKLFSDISVIGVDILSKGAIHLAQKIAPTDEELLNVDRSAPDDEFITAGGRPVGPEETAVPEISVPGTSKTLQQHPNENEPRIVEANGTEKTTGEVTQQVEGIFGESRDRAHQNGAEAFDKAQGHPVTDSPPDTEGKKMGMREKMRQMGVSPLRPIYPRIYLPLAFVE